MQNCLICDGSREFLWSRKGHFMIIYELCWKALWVSDTKDTLRWHWSPRTRNELMRCWTVNNLKARKVQGNKCYKMIEKSHVRNLRSWWMFFCARLTQKMDISYWWAQNPLSRPIFHDNFLDVTRIISMNYVCAQQISDNDDLCCFLLYD